MDDRKWERYAALGGIWFVVFAIVGGLIAGSPPAANASADKVVKFFHDHTGAIEASQVLIGIGSIGLLWWFGSLYRRMSRAEEGRPRLAIAAALGLAMSGVFYLTGNAILATTALRIDDAEGAARFFYTFSNVLLATAGFFNVVFTASVVALTFRTRMLPQWTGYVGALAALGFLIATIGSASDATVWMVIGIISFVAWVIWLVAVSISMWRESPALEVVAVVEVTTA